MRGPFLVLAFALTGCAPHVSQVPPPKPLPKDATPLPTETHRFQPHEDLIGKLYKIRIEEGDTLPRIARHFNLGFEEIRLANPGVDVWLPEVGQEVILPLRFIFPEAERRGIVVNTAAYRLFYFERPDQVWTSPVGVGRQGWRTPLGRTRIVEKRKDPAWVVPESIRREHARRGSFLPKVVPPGPNNPLGKYALRLGFRSYLIHGTNKPYGVGMRVSHGCLRLYPEAIEWLFHKVRVGTPVQIVEQPYVVGWHGGMLYLQVYPLASSERARRAKFKLFLTLKRIEKRYGVEMDWPRVRRLLETPRAIPFPILKGSPEPEAVLAQAEPIPHPTRLQYRYTPPPLTSGWYLRHPEPLPYRTALRYMRMLHHMGPPFPAHVISERGEYVLIIGPYPSRKGARRALWQLRRDFPLRFRMVSLKFGEMAIF